MCDVCNVMSDVYLLFISGAEVEIEVMCNYLNYWFIY